MEKKNTVCFETLPKRDEILLFVNEVRNFLHPGFFEKMSCSKEKYRANKIKKIRKLYNKYICPSTADAFIEHLGELEENLKKGFKNVLLKPDENENYIYNPFNGEGVIVKSLVSKSPINKKEHKTTIEKLVVDIVTDKTINMFFEEAEKKDVVSNIFEKYALKFDSVRNYAKRRHSLDRFLDYVPVKYISLFYD